MTKQIEKIEVDPTLLLVSGNKNKGNKESDVASVKKLAYALIETINKHNEARLKCVGAAAVNNAIKAFTIASLDEKVVEIYGTLLSSSEFGIAKFNNGEEEKTAIVLTVRPASAYLKKS